MRTIRRYEKYYIFFSTKCRNGKFRLYWGVRQYNFEKFDYLDYFLPVADKGLIRHKRDRNVKTFILKQIYGVQGVIKDSRCSATFIMDFSSIVIEADNQNFQTRLF